jgi:hypothetical protein
MAVKYKEVPVQPSRAFCFVLQSKTCSNQANLMSLFVHPVGEKLTKTSCFIALIAATHEPWSVLFANKYIRAGGKVLPSAQTAATTVIHSQEPSWSDIRTFFDVTDVR